MTKTGFMVSTQEAKDTLEQIRDDTDPEVWNWAKDLGVCVRWMGKDKNPVMEKRVKGVRTRARKIGRLSETAGFRKEAIGASALAHGMYGSAISGIPPSIMEKLEVEARMALDGGNKPKR